MSFPTIPGYQIERELGQGGMAKVYLAHEEKLDRQVALKMLTLLSEEGRPLAERFVKEAKTAARLHHSHIITIHDVGRAENCYYMAVEYLPGGTLRERMLQGPLAPPEALRVIGQMATALGYAHEQGFIHRDIKPENIMFRRDGMAVLTDFGIAKAVGSTTKLTKTGMSIGTPHYMSPEQARGKELDGRSDLYSLGIVLYEMLTGRVPFEAEDSIAIAVKHIQEPIPTLPAPLSRHQALLNRLLAKDPVNRFQSGAELVAALNSPGVGAGFTSARSSDQSAPTPNRVPPGHDSPHRPTPPPKPKTGPQTRMVNNQDEGEDVGARLASASKRNIAIGLGGVVAILLAILVGVLISDNAKKQDSEAWSEARRENTVLSYRSYLSSHPDGQYAGLAREQQGQLEEAARREEQRRQQAARELAAQQERERQEAERKRLAAEQRKREEQERQSSEPVTEPAWNSGTRTSSGRFGIEMVRIPGGTFQMGSDSSESYGDEKPVHSVNVSTFYLSKTEVTQGQWKAVMGNNPSGSKTGDNYPVERVSWNDAQEFIRKLNQQTGKRYRLPTEAEWEYAARGGSSADRYGNLDSIAWYDGNSGGSTRPVAQKQANSYGLYDMLGNVWEWVGDWKGDYSSYSQDNPTGPSAGSFRVFRGGSWDFTAGSCRAPIRFRYTPDYRFTYLGFRLAAVSL